MGDRNIAEFFCSCDNGYLSGNLSPSLRSMVIDEDAIMEHAKSFIISERKTGDIDKDTARENYNNMVYFSGSLETNYDLLRRVYGEEFWHVLPERPNHEYTYLCRIIDAVKEAIKKMENEG